MMKETTINQNEVRTILAVFEELTKMPYEQLNTFLGSLTIEEMMDLKKKLNDWYQPEVLGKSYDEEYGWYNPNTEF